MATVTVEIRNVPGTEAALGWAGSHTVVIDRPEGKAGGMGLGFNGAQLLALTIGGCFANDLRYKAAELDFDLRDISISVDLQLDGAPLMATHVTVRVHVDAGDDAAGRRLVDEVSRTSMAANSISRGIPVVFVEA